MFRYFYIIFYFILSCVNFYVFSLALNNNNLVMTLLSSMCCLIMIGKMFGSLNESNSSGQ